MPKIIKLLRTLIKKSHPTRFLVETQDYSEEFINILIHTSGGSFPIKLSYGTDGKLQVESENESLRKATTDEEFLQEFLNLVSSIRD